jgi:hypothetical protein
MPPRIKGFLSYATSEKAIAAQAKEVLSKLGVRCFLAHDDIEISEDWTIRIKQELSTMDVFIPLLSAKFKASEYAPQEVGFAVCRSDVLIIPVSVDNTPAFGFISHLQARSLPPGFGPDVFSRVLASRFSRTVIPALINDLAGAQSYRGAEALMRPLIPIFDQFDESEANALAKASIANSEIWSASLCRSDYIPAFLDTAGHLVEPALREALEEKIQW